MRGWVKRSTGGKVEKLREKRARDRKQCRKRGSRNRTSGRKEDVEEG
jgi:hypothetical protein